MKKEHLINIYRLYFEQENFFVTNYENRTQFYMSIITLLLTGITTGLFFTSEWYHYVLLIFGVIILVSVAILAKDAVWRSYRRALEMVTMKTKIEIALGLNENINHKAKTEHPWKHEPVIPSRYLKDHANFGSSDVFLDTLAKQNYGKTLFKVFNLVIWIGIGLLGLLGYLLWVTLFPIT